MTSVDVQRLNIATRGINHSPLERYYQNRLRHPVDSGLSNGECFSVDQNLLCHLVDSDLSNGGCFAVDQNFLCHSVDCDLSNGECFSMDQNLLWEQCWRSVGAVVRALAFH